MSPLHLPLVFGSHRARVDQDPDALARLINRSVPVRDLAPRDPRQPFLHRAAQVQGSQLAITAAAHTPLRGANHAQAQSIFTLTIIGEKRFLVEGRPFQARAGHSALLLPGAAYTLETTLSSGVLFSVSPEVLAERASTMSGLESALRFAPIHHPVELLESHPPLGNLLGLVRRCLRLIDQLVDDNPRLPKALGLDDKLLRLLALLLYPQLLHPDTADRPPFSRRADEAFADLLAALRADLPGDWTLTRMERQAGLSRRQLRLHFQRHMGCAPMEWLRFQRLCWARQQLEEGDPISLAQLALRCGYADLSAFREAFENRFHIPPEALLSLNDALV